MIRKVEFRESQRDLYESHPPAMDQRVRTAMERNGLARTHIVILDALLKLRQVCCDPRLVSLEAARRCTSRPSSNCCSDMLPALLEEGRRVLLFSQFTGMLGPDRGRSSIAATSPTSLLTGETRDRADARATFPGRRGPAVPLSAQGRRHGTQPHRGRHRDPLRPVVESGGRGAGHRSRPPHRPGQAGVRLPADHRGTVEEKMVALQVRKRELVQSLLEEGSSGPVGLQKSDLEYLFAPLV